MKYGLIGEKLCHSYSPEIHRRLRGYGYQLWQLSQEELPCFFQRRAFQGVNVTIPYKKTAMRFCDALSETAQRMGCVNTIIKREDGTLFGDNTDLLGFQFLLEAAGIALGGKEVLVLGNGGASSAVQMAASAAGASGITVAGRSGDVNYSNLYQRCARTQIVINATPVGMFPNSNECLVEPWRFPALQAAIDLIYNPLRTQMLQQAEQRNCSAVNGLSMLVAQAAAAASLFTGEAQPAGDVAKVTREMRSELENWVLIGMPGCGKSTIGVYLAGRSNRSFIDLDCEIEKAIGMPCEAMLRQCGEAEFRAVEAEVLNKISENTGQVIATGGGAVLRKENVTSLRQNGRLLWIQRGIAYLPTAKRPLSVDLSALEQARAPLYQAAADMTIIHNEDWEAVKSAAWEAFCP